jgi:asparagine synthase (glutamine-hydrolysing)
MRVRGFAKKRLLRKAIAPLLPGEIARARKQGFSIPAAAWLRGDLEPFARDVLSPEALARQGFFEPGTVRALIDAHVSRRDDHSRQLWGLLAFTLWFDRYGVGAENRAPARIP